MNKSDVIGKVRADLLFIKEHINALVDLLKESNVDPDSVVFQMPSLHKDDIGAGDTQIHPTPIMGDMAFTAFIEHIGQFSLEGEHPGVMAKRLPGYIVIRSHQAQEIVERIKIINKLKNDFHELVYRFAGKSPDERFETVSAAVPNIIRKAVVRQLLLAPDDVVGINLNWSRPSSYSKVEHRIFWEEKLDRTLLSKQPAVGEKDWETAIKMEKEALLQCNDTDHFRSIRPLRVNPILNIRYNRDDVTKQYEKTTLVAHSPLIILNQKPTMSYLKTYQGKSTKTRPVQPVIERLHLYPVYG